MLLEVDEMFTYVKLKNFKSLKEACFDFRNGSKGPKKFIAIYGENGSGKSNFVESIDLLRKSIDSFEMVSNTEKIREITQEKEMPQELLETLLSFINFDKFRNECRMVECDEPTSIEYGFEYNGHEGIYEIAFEERFLHEKLYYFTGKQRGVIYEISAPNGDLEINFSNKLFNTKKVEEEIRDEISKYWGRHTLLSIFRKEKAEKNEKYIKESYLEFLFDIITMLEDSTIRKKGRENFSYEAGKPNNVLTDLRSGKIKKDGEEILDRTERVVKDFFTQAYADIKDVYYERKVDNDTIFYKLYVKKMIGERIRTIDFANESEGTKHILEIIRTLLGAFCGVTVVYDEIDDGIHDLLLKTVLESMVDDITGQLIITTHNTYMLETIDIKSVYIINVDYEGNKEIKCLDKYPRIQGTNNPRIMYLKGLFGGVPIVDVLDYGAILEELEIEGDKMGGDN